jgi:hypothetical protein
MGAFFAGGMMRFFMWFRDTHLNARVNLHERNRFARNYYRIGMLIMRTFFGRFF